MHCHGLNSFGVRLTSWCTDRDPTLLLFHLLFMEGQPSVSECSAHVLTQLRNGTFSDYISKNPLVSMGVIVQKFPNSVHPCWYQPSWAWNDFCLNLCKIACGHIGQYWAKETNGRICYNAASCLLFSPIDCCLVCFWGKEPRTKKRTEIVTGKL